MGRGFGVWQAVRGDGGFNCFSCNFLKLERFSLGVLNENNQLQVW